MKILHFSPVKKPYKIVKQHLRSLQSLETSREIEITFSFFDDNTDILSSQLVNEFVVENNAILFKETDINIDKSKIYDKRWETDLYLRITKIKDYVLDFFEKSDFDFIFLCDSDLIVHPNTVLNLYHQKKDFIAEIFWTKFEGGTTYTPNCWYEKHRGFDKIDLLRFRDLGTYEVDYTGACTLLSKRIISSGVRFRKINNVGFLGEDKHFCIRASVNEYKIYINTETPAFHLYNEKLVEEGQKFIDSNFSLKYLENWLNNDWESKLDQMLHQKKKSKTKRLLNKIANKF